MAGRPTKSLAEKLGIKPGMRISVLHAPDGYVRTLGDVPSKVSLVTGGHDLDIVQYFCTQRQALASVLPGLKEKIKPTGAIWVFWPKKISGVKTDLDENVVRHHAIRQGLVDVKVVAVDPTWSALKLVIPRSERRRSV